MTKLAQARRFYASLSASISLQFAQQLANLASGFLVIRILSKHEFAIYSIVTTIISLAAVLADCQTSLAVSSYAASKSSNRKYIASLLEAARNLQEKMLIIALSLSFGVYVAMADGVMDSYVQIAILFAIACATVYFQRYISLTAALFNGLHNPVPMQRIQTLLSVGRLGALALVLVNPNAVVANLSTLLVTFAAYLWVKRSIESANSPISFVNEGISDKRLVDLLSNRLKRFIIPLALPAIYSAFQGSILVLIAGLIGTPETIANVAALSRFTLIFSIFSSVSTAVVLPKLSSSANAAQYRARCAAFGGQAIALSLLLCLACILVPNFFLWILGPKYYGLENELLLSMVNGSIVYCANTAYLCLASKGQTEKQYLTIPLSFVPQVLTIYFSSSYPNLAPFYTGIAGASGVLVTEVGLLVLYMRRVRRRPRGF